MTLYSPTLGLLSLPEVVARIHEFCDAAPEYQHKIIIGTDSAPPIDGTTDLITAVVVHRIGNGGIYFIYRQPRAKLFTLRDRMYHEALQSIGLGKELTQHNLLQPSHGSQDVLEIHLDIGENGPTRQMIREIVGMVIGYGFRVKTKPQAYGANKVADRHT